MLSKLTEEMKLMFCFLVFLNVFGQKFYMRDLQVLLICLLVKIINYASVCFCLRWCGAFAPV